MAIFSEEIMAKKPQLGKAIPLRDACTFSIIITSAKESLLIIHKLQKSGILFRIDMSENNNQKPNNSEQNSRNRHHHNDRPRNSHPNQARNNHHNSGAPRNQQHPNGQRPSNNQQGQNTQQNASAGANKNNNNRKRNNRRNRYGKRPNAPRAATGPVPASEKRPPHLDRAYEKYQNLLDQHLIARKKYFELFYRADTQQKAKLERNFYQTLYDLRDFEEKATAEIKEFLLIKTNGRSEDYIYSENHALTKEGKLEVEGEKFEDPHLLPSQIRADFSEDTEESMGSLDDYKNYKGL